MISTMSNSNPSFDRYLSEEGQIRGPMPLECAFLIGAVLQALNNLNVVGDMMEIGVFEGRSAIPAACFLRPAENFLSIDPFEDITSASSTLTYGGVGNDEKFIQNWKRVFGNTEQLTVLKVLSSAVVQSEELRSTWKPFKYISVDGDHSVEGTLLDLHLAKQHIANNGVIAVDDVFNIEWPSVSQALNEFLAEDGGLCPLCLGWGRLFLCKRDHFKTLQEEVHRAFMTYEKYFHGLLRIISTFEYYGVSINVYTDRWGSASKPPLRPEGYEIGKKYQHLLETAPKQAMLVRDAACVKK